MAANNEQQHQQDKSPTTPKTQHESTQGTIQQPLFSGPHNQVGRADSTARFYGELRNVAEQVVSQLTRQAKERRAKERRAEERRAKERLRTAS